MEKIKNTLEQKRLSIVSRLDKHLISITLENGHPKGVAFFDIDKTLAHLDEIHTPAMKAFGASLGLSANDIENIDQMYYRGFKLGTSYREFDRMWHIYFGNKPQWKDNELYKTERLSIAQDLIDNPQSDDHKRAAEMMNKYFSFVAEFVKNQDQSVFENSIIKPLYRLMEIYKRLGIPMFGMTANGREFVKELVKALHLNEYFIDVATDEDMAAGGLPDDPIKDKPGGKEAIIPSCLRTLGRMGIKNTPMIICVGDSFNGDIGSAHRTKLRDPNPDVEYKGIFIVENDAELNAIQADVEKTKSLKDIVDNVSIEAIKLDEFTETFFKKEREQYTERI